jgi:hypothetical protein
MLLTNGRTYTLDARGTIADTLVVRDGRVAFAGRRADVNAAPGEDIVDLDQRAQRGPESVVGRTPSFQGHARSGRAGSSGRARAHRRACDLSRYRPRRSNPSISAASARAN